MNIRRSEIEDDVKQIISYLKSNDYVVPSVSQIVTPIIWKAVVVYVSHVILSVLLCVMVFKIDDLISFLVIDAVGVAVATLVVIAMWFTPLTIFKCFDENIVNQSVLIRMTLNKAKRYYLVALGLSIIVPMFMVLITPVGSVFGIVTLIFLSFVMPGLLMASMSRYLTPSTIGLLSTFTTKVTDWNH